MQGDEHGLLRRNPRQYGVDWNFPQGPRRPGSAGPDAVISADMSGDHATQGPHHGGDGWLTQGDSGSRQQENHVCPLHQCFFHPIGHLTRMAKVELSAAEGMAHHARINHSPYDTDYD